MLSRIGILYTMPTHKDDNIHIRLKKELKARIYKAAQQDGRSMSGYIRHVVIQNLPKHDS